MKTFLKIFLAILAVALFMPTHGVLCIALAPFGITDLNKYAEDNFSSFEGDENFFEGYTGEGDDLLDFGGASGSFATEINNPRIFVMTLVNAYAGTRTAYIIPGNLWLPGKVSSVTSVTTTTAAGDPLVYTSTTTNTNVYPSGFVRDGAFNDINGSSGLTGSGSPKTVEAFFAFIKGNPITCNAIKVQSDSTTQIDQLITQRANSPFRTLEDKIWIPGAYQNQDTQRDKISLFPTTGLILSDQTQLEYPIVASSTCTITFFCGTPLNTAKALERKQQKAVTTIATVGLGNVQRYHAVKGGGAGMLAGGNGAGGGAMIAGR